MDKKTKNDLLDIAAELVVAPITAYVKGREIYKNFTESDTSKKIVNYAGQKGQEIQNTAKKISINLNEKASQFADDISDKAVDFSKKAEEFTKKAEEKIAEFDERKETMLYQFADKAEDKIKEFSENVKTTAKDFSETVQQKFYEMQEGASAPAEPEFAEEPVVLQSVVEEVEEPTNATEEPVSVTEEPTSVVEEPVVLPSAEEEPIAPQANTIFENTQE